MSRAFEGTRSTPRAFPVPTYLPHAIFPHSLPSRTSQSTKTRHHGKSGSSRDQPRRTPYLAQSTSIVVRWLVRKLWIMAIEPACRISDSHRRSWSYYAFRLPRVKIEGGCTRPARMMQYSRIHRSRLPNLAPKVDGCIGERGLARGWHEIIMPK